MFPEVQEKAQKEIDKVVGDRVPIWEDMENVPYVRCLVKEVWRWRPPVALGHPHETTKEIAYQGCRLPKGARIHINAWAIGHDSARHQDPERFWPERFANDHTNVSRLRTTPFCCANITCTKRCNPSTPKLPENAITSLSELGDVSVLATTSPNALYP
jgi:cytochrome P450